MNTDGCTAVLAVLVLVLLVLHLQTELAEVTSRGT
jgi:hypothetical protein